jgi:4-amino-4-deoxychorismate mutase
MTLGGFREQIDQIDDDIVDLLGRRLELVRQVARAKKATAIPVMQPERVLEVKRRCKERGAALNLRGEFVERLYQFIIDEACRVEDDFVGVVKEHARAPFRRADLAKTVSE